MKPKIIAFSTLGALALIPLAVLSTGTGTAGTAKTTRSASPLSSHVTGSPMEKTGSHSQASALSPSTSASRASQLASAGKSSRSSKQQHSDEPSAEQRRAKTKVSDLTTTQKSKMLTLLNEGEAEQLAAIKGISTTRAAAIERARPFASIDEVVLVPGIGESTFASVIEHARSLTARRSSSSSSRSRSSSSGSSTSKSRKS